MTQVSPWEIQLREVSAAKLVGYLHRLPGAPGCRKTRQVKVALPIPKALLTRVKILQKCKRSAGRRGKETLITATISSPPPHLTLPCSGLLPPQLLTTCKTWDMFFNLLLPSGCHLLRSPLQPWALPHPAPPASQPCWGDCCRLCCRVNRTGTKLRLLCPGDTGYLFLQPLGHLCSMFPGGPISRVQWRDAQVGPVKSWIISGRIY